MSRRRAADEPPITLFSFQDIITCLTGILILIALLLALDVLVRSGAAEEARHERSGPAMPARIDELRARAGLLREAVQMIPNPAAPRPSGQAVSMPEEIPAGELPRRIEEEAKRAEVAEAGRREIETAISALNQESARERERDAATEIRVAELRRRAADLEREAARLRSGQVVEFLPGERDALQPILIECSRNGFRACFYGAEGAAQEFADADAVTVESARQGLMEWLQGRNSSAESIVLFLKPSAAGFARELIDDLKASGWMLGFEAMEEDKSILLAPRRKG